MAFEFGSTDGWVESISDLCSSSESAVLHIGSEQSLKRHPEVDEFFLFCIKNKLKAVNKKSRNGTKRSRPTVVKVSKGAAGPPSLLLATNQSELS